MNHDTHVFRDGFILSDVKSYCVLLFIVLSFYGLPMQCCFDPNILNKFDPMRAMPAARVLVHCGFCFTYSQLKLKIKIYNAQ